MNQSVVVEQNAQRQIRPHGTLWVRVYVKMIVCATTIAYETMIVEATFEMAFSWGYVFRVVSAPWPWKFRRQSKPLLDQSHHRFLFDSAIQCATGVPERGRTSQ